MLRKLGIAALLAFSLTGTTPATADVPAATGELVRTASGYVDTVSGTVYSTPVPGPDTIGPLQLVDTPRPATQRWSWGLYYDEVGGGLYLIIEDGSDLWIIPL